MSTSTPTRNAAYGLLSLAHSGEEFARFVTLDALALGLAQRIDTVQRCYGECLPHECVLGFGKIWYWEKVLKERVHSDFGLATKSTLMWASFEAFGPSGASLGLGALLARGTALLDAIQAEKRLHWYCRAAYCGWGPVPGVRKYRGGSGWYRSVATAAEARQNSLIVREDGEPNARAARCGMNLPTSRDDVSRHVERCWKRQHRGVKAWDR